MPAGTYDLFIEQGATFVKQITWKDPAGNPINLTGFSARLQVRKDIKATTPFISLTDAAGIALGGPAGTIILTVSATATSAIVESKGIYDLEMQAGDGVVTRLLEGKVTIKPEVTR